MSQMGEVLLFDDLKLCNDNCLGLDGLTYNEYLLVYPKIQSEEKVDPDVDFLFAHGKHCTTT